MNKYAAILDQPHHVSQKHPPLPPESRAAQFSPFAALTGYDDAVVEITGDGTLTISGVAGPDNMGGMFGPMNGMNSASGEMRR